MATVQPEKVTVNVICAGGAVGRAVGCMQVDGCASVTRGCGGAVQSVWCMVGNLKQAGMYKQAPWCRGMLRHPGAGSSANGAPPHAWHGAGGDALAVFGAEGRGAGALAARGLAGLAGAAHVLRRCTNQPTNAAGQSVTDSRPSAHSSTAGAAHASLMGCGADHAAAVGRAIGGGGGAAAPCGPPGGLSSYCLIQTGVNLHLSESNNT